jgi:CRISPR type III-B/RAMP module RAMP protein Cmr1
MPKLLARLPIETLTPISLGGYDTKMSRQIGKVKIDEILRPSSIKGVWRWWTRAYLAGAAHDAQHRTEDILEVVGALLGTTREQASASRLILRVDVSRTKVKDAENSFNDIERIPRLMLLYAKEIGVLRRIRRQEERRPIQPLIQALRELQDEKGYPLEEVIKMVESRRFNDAVSLFKEKVLSDFKHTFKQIEGVLEVYERSSSTLTLNRDEVTLALGSLLTALKLGGLGKNSRRGFGSCSIRFNEEFFLNGQASKLIEALKLIENESAINKVKEGIRQLVNETYTAALRVIGAGENVVLGERAFPKIPSITRNSKAFKLLLFTNKKLDEIGGSLVRTSQAPRNLVREIIGIKFPQQPLRKPLAWVLGLPRSARIRGRKTGYFIPEGRDGEEEGRRASPLIFSKLNRNIWVLTLMFSTDFPAKIKSKGRGRRDYWINFNPRTGAITWQGEDTSLDHLVHQIVKYYNSWFQAVEVDVFG